jgi:urease accessory protein
VVVAPDAEARLEAVRDLLERCVGVEAGCSAFDGMLAARLVGMDALALRTALAAVLEHLRGQLPRVWSC